MVTKKSQMERVGKGVGGDSPDVNQVDLLSFLHELEGNLNVLSLLNREARVCLGSAVEWVKGEEGEKGEYSDCSYHNYKKAVYSFPFPSRCTSFKMYLTSHSSRCTLLPLPLNF